MHHPNEELDEDTTYAKEALICKIGDQLKQARLSKDLSYADVIEDLNLNVIFLEALEHGDWSEMPGDIYALGFLRQYAKFLNVDLHEDIQRIKTNKYELTKPITYPDAAISPNKTWAISAILLFFLAIIVSNLFESSEQGVAVPHEVKVAVAPLQPSQDLYAEPKQALASLTVYDIENKGNTVVHSTTRSAQKEHASPDNKSQTIAFFAVSADVWLQVYQEVANQEPALLREAYLKVNESFSTETAHPLLLTTGNPAALEVSLNGDIIFPQGSLGKEGKVLKLYPINPIAP